LLSRCTSVVAARNSHHFVRCRRAISMACRNCSGSFRSRVSPANIHELSHEGGSGISDDSAQPGFVVYCQRPAGTQMSAWGRPERSTFSFRGKLHPP
jgi:hypothetical protein